MSPSVATEARPAGHETVTKLQHLRARPGDNPKRVDFRHHVSVHLLATLAILASGLQGTVTKGPIMPVCRVGQPCSGPAQVTLSFTRTLSPGHYRLYWLRTSPTGRFRALLPPGYYTVKIKERIGIIPNIRPARVHVRAGHVDTINFYIDTGIR
jgi:hypothetical protein